MLWKFQKRGIFCFPLKDGSYIAILRALWQDICGRVEGFIKFKKCEVFETFTTWPSKLVELINAHNRGNNDFQQHKRIPWTCTKMTVLYVNMLLRPCWGHQQSEKVKREIFDTLRKWSLECVELIRAHERPLKFFLDTDIYHEHAKKQKLLQNQHFFRCSWCPSVLFAVGIVVIVGTNQLYELMR